MTQEAVVYKRRERFLVHADSKTETGLWIACEPFLAVDDGEAGALEDAIGQAIAHSKSGLPHPSSFDGIVEPLLDLAHVKSWSTFLRGTAACRVVKVGSRLEVIPMTRSGQGYDLGESEKVVLEDPVRGELELAVRSQL